MRAKLSVWSSFNLTPSSPLRWPLKAMSKLKRQVYWKLENVKKGSQLDHHNEAKARAKNLADMPT